MTAQVFDVPRLSRRLGAIGRGIVKRRLERFQPDFIICTRHAWQLGAEKLRALFDGRRSAFWYFDFEPQPGVVDLARLCDEVYITCASQAEKWRGWVSHEVHFLPQGVDPDVDRPGIDRPEFRCDVSFVGSGQYPFRWPLLQRIAAHHDLQVRGPGWQDAPGDIPIAGGEIRLDHFNDVAASSRVSLGANATAEQDSGLASASNRMWKLFGCGAAYLGPWVPGIDRWARDGEHCRWYHDTDEALSILDELLCDNEGRQAMARRGHEHALTHHCYHHRLELLLAGKGYEVEGDE